MSHLRYVIQQQKAQNMLTEMNVVDVGITEFLNELIPALEQWEDAIQGKNVPLMEATGKLSDDQIYQIFLSAAKIHKTGFLDRVGNAASKVKGIIAKYTDKLQNSKPVEAFDAKADKLLQTIRNEFKDDAKVVQMAQKLGEFGKKHPNWTAGIIGTLTAVASMAGSPAAGAIVGGVLRTVVGLAKGEKASTAIGKAVKVAALGTVAGVGIKHIGDFMDIVSVSPDADIGELKSKIPGGNIENLLADNDKFALIDGQPVTLDQAKQIKSEFGEINQENRQEIHKYMKDKFGINFKAHVVPDSADLENV